MNCPRCHTGTGGAKAVDSKIKCSKCSFEMIDEDADEAYGVRRVDTVDNHGTPIIAYENTGDGWKRFPSWYCLKFFDTLQQRLDHDHKYHKIGDTMAGMIPSGYVTFEPSCNKFYSRLLIILRNMLRRLI